MLKILKFALVSLVGCGFLAMIAYALWMREEIRDAQIEPPLIAAPDTPVKRRPEEPGGMEIPNRDKLVFDLLDSDTPSQAVSSATAEASGTEDIVAAEPSATEEPVPEEAVAAPAPVAAVKPVVAMPQVKPLAEAKPAAPAKAEAPKEAPKVLAKVETKPAPKPVAKEEPKVAGGAWGVQVGAVGSKADGEALAKKLTGKYAALKPLSPRVVAVTSGGTTKYRVQFLGASSRTAAAAVCGKLAGQACFPVGK